MIEKHSLPPILARVVLAMNSHDVHQLVGCFAPDYSSDHMVHLHQSISGHEAIRRKWQRTFKEVPDFQCEVVSFAMQPTVLWVEWQWRGHEVVERVEMKWRGVNIFGIDQEVIVWARPYMELVDSSEEANANE
jgi:hypothetical protein